MASKPLVEASPLGFILGVVLVWGIWMEVWKARVIYPPNCFQKLRSCTEVG